MVVLLLLMLVGMLMMRLRLLMGHLMVRRRRRVAVLSTMMLLMMVLVMVVARWGRRHVVATVWQMRRVLHANLVAMVMRYMTLRCFQQRWLYVGNELSHFLGRKHLAR